MASTIPSAGSDGSTITYAGEGVKLDVKTDQGATFRQVAGT